MSDGFGRFLRMGLCSVLAVVLFPGCQTNPPEARAESEEALAKTMVVTPAPVPVEAPVAHAQAGAMRPVRTAGALLAMSPMDALTELRAGNARFVSGQMRGRTLSEERHSTVEHQFPFAIIVSCIDSRVPVEMVFDQGIGDVFNARVAGNVLNDDIVGSVEYACKVAGAKLIVVLGHSNCGAVKGAIDDVQLGKLTELVAKIKPAEDMVPQSVQPRTSKNHELVERAAENNVQLVMREIRLQSPILRQMLDAGKIGLVGGMYHLETGEARFMAN